MTGPREPPGAFGPTTGERTVKHARLDATIAASLKAMGAGRVVYVPGLRNKVLASSVGESPRPVIRRLVRSLQQPG